MAAKIKSGDRVVLLAGKDKGKQGKVLKVMPKDERLVVEGLNMVQRHTKASQTDPQGGIKNKEASVHVSNVAIVELQGRAHPRRLPHGRRQEGALRQDHGRDDQWLSKTP